MSRRCHTCAHPSRREIDRALVDGVPVRRLAIKHGVDKMSLQRHRASHIAGPVRAAERAAEAAGVEHGGTLLDLMGEAVAEARAVLGELRAAKPEDRWRYGPRWLAEVRRAAEVIGRVRGELPADTTEARQRGQVAAQKRGFADLVREMREEADRAAS